MEVEYIKYDLNKDTFQSEDDKFLYLESKLESDLSLIKIGIKNIKQNKNQIIEQLSLQRKLLNDLETLEYKVKKIKMSMKKFSPNDQKIDDRIEATEGSNMDRIFKKTQTLVSYEKQKPIYNTPFVENDAENFISNIEYYSNCGNLKLENNVRYIEEKAEYDNENNNLIDEINQHKLNSTSEKTFQYLQMLSSLRK